MLLCTLTCISVARDGETVLDDSHSHVTCLGHVAAELFILCLSARPPGSVVKEGEAAAWASVIQGRSKIGEIQ